MEDWHIPWPEHFPHPSEGWSQDNWTLVINRWMKTAWTSVAKPLPQESRREWRKAVQGVARLGREGRLPISSKETVAFGGDLETVLRGSIVDAILNYQPDMADFTTYLDRVARNRTIDHIKKESRWRRLNRNLTDQDRRRVRSPSDDPTPRWAADIDWNMVLEVVAVRFGPEYALLALDRFENGLTQKAHADHYGFSLRAVKYREKRLKESIHDILGQEAVLYRQEVLERDRDGTA